MSVSNSDGFAYEDTVSMDKRFDPDEPETSFPLETLASMASFKDKVC